MINIYEVNRKEGARILMEIHRWLSPGTFRLEGDREATGIILQNCLIEVSAFPNWCCYRSPDFDLTRPFYLNFSTFLVQH
jgi:hypothetical protein